MNKYRFWLLLIILIALVLRLYNLTYHSFWFDEAVSVYWAKQTVPRILEVGFTLIEDRLPPLYYLMLKGWSNVFGFSEASIRALSVLFGVLLIPVITAISALLFRQRTALFASALVALNPFLIWYAQEARMYAPAVFFGSLAIWAWLQIIKTSTSHTPRPTSHAPRPTPHVPRPTSHVPRPTSHALHLSLFILSTIAGLYSHLYTGFLLPALGLWLIISYPRRWRLLVMFAISGIIITLAYAPILLAIWRFSSEAAPGDPLMDLPHRAWWLLQSFTVWKATPSPNISGIIPVITIIFALCAYRVQSSEFRVSSSELRVPNLPISQSPNPPISNPLLLITLLLIIPFIIANILLSRNHLAFFGERYFIIMTPWLLILAALGADNLGHKLQQITSHVPRTTFHVPRPTSHIPIIILVISSTIPLFTLWNPSTTKEAWRQSVAYLANMATAKHGILIHPDWVRYPFQYYFAGPGQTYAAFSNVTGDTPLDGPLQGVINNHKVIWLVQSHLAAPDPERRVEQWFAARYPLVTELYPPGITLKGYAPGYQLDTLPPEATSINVTFENGLRLVGYQTNTVVSATDDLFHPPSGWVHVTLYWRADTPIVDDISPFVHLVGPEGVWGVSLERSTDALKLYPTSRWAVAGPIIRHDVDVNLNPAVPPGIYQLVVGVPEQNIQYPFSQVEVRE